MITEPATYPRFEANQVLTDAQLNEVHDHLYAHVRSTRALLIGIGIVCGLEVRFDPTHAAITITKGCGVTSEGYLVTEPRNVTLTKYREYKVPPQLGYDPFTDRTGPQPTPRFPLLELLPDDEPDPTSRLDGLTLDGKVVVLFLELKQDDLRSCSPTSCADRGSSVTATVRRLLIDQRSLDTIIDEAEPGSPRVGTKRLPAGFVDHLDLPDLRLPRVDVPNTGLVTSEQVLQAFQTPFARSKLVRRTFEALGGLRQVFAPMLDDQIPDDAFDDFWGRFGFLESGPTSSPQVRSLPNHWDLFDDILRAYDEVRWAGADLLCACCPSEDLFPRHLMLGAVTPSPTTPAARYRQPWMASPATSRCEDQVQLVRTLFLRLVRMVSGFDPEPSLLAVKGEGKGIDSEIRVTPSRWGDAALETRAIPHYYELDGAPPLHHLWNPALTRRHRPEQNLGYRSSEYHPAAPDFVLEPLRFELEPHDFLRVEGHLGKSVRKTMRTLESFRTQHRLPIDVVALRTGTLDGRAGPARGSDAVRVTDVDPVYGARRAELICFLCDQVQILYDLPDPSAGPLVARPPELDLLRSCAPDYLVRPRTVGRRIESPSEVGHALGRGPSRAFVDAIDVVVQAAEALAAALPGRIDELGTDDLGARRRELDLAIAAALAARFEDMEERAADGVPDVLEEHDLIGQLRAFRSGACIDPLLALRTLYEQRVREMEQAHHLGSFLERHPGIQHKAGVPLGGTFILVYHEEGTPEPEAPRGLIELEPIPFGGGDRVEEVRSDDASGGRESAGDAIDPELEAALATLPFRPDLADDPVVKTIFQLLKGRPLATRPAPNGPAGDTYRSAVGELRDGTVIADFFLPYLCCSDQPPSRYALPAPPIELEARLSCTDEKGQAEVQVIARGSSGSISIRVDEGEPVPLQNPVVLGVGPHTLVASDDAGVQSAPMTVTVPAHLELRLSHFDVDQDAGTAVAVAAIVGGTPPYTATGGTLRDATTITSDPGRLRSAVEVAVEDAEGCTAAATFETPVPGCVLPGGGLAEKRGYRFWLPTPKSQFPLKELHVESAALTFGEDGSGVVHDVSVEVTEALAKPGAIAASKFDALAEKWIAEINAAIEAEVGPDWLVLSYSPAAEGTTVGTLWIERLTAVSFTFRVVMGFVDRDEPRVLESVYRPDVYALVEESESFVPAKLELLPHDGSSRDKCKGEDETPRCGDVDLTAEILAEVRGSELALEAKSSGASVPVIFLWEVGDRPRVVAGQQATVPIEALRPGDVPIVLWMFTEDGCRSRVPVTDTVKVG